MANEELLEVYISRKSGPTTPDPEQSLGGIRTGVTVYRFQSTVTSVTNTSIFADSTRIGDPDRVGAYIVFYTGPNLREARKVVAFNSTTGEYTLEFPLPNTISNGEIYRLFAPNELFNPLTNEQSVIPPPFGVNRCVYYRNFTGSSFSANTFRCWYEAIEKGPIDLLISCGAPLGSPDVAFLDEGEEGEPDITTDFGLVTGFANTNTGNTWRPQVFRQPPSYSSAVDTPRNFNFNFSNNFALPIWLSLRRRQGEPIPIATRCVWHLFFGDTTTFSSWILIVDVLGADEEVLTGPDRIPRISAGARVQAQVRDKLTGAPVPNHRAEITLVSPSPGSLEPQNSLVTTDDGNPVRAVYLSPTDPGEEGEDVTFRVKVN